MKVVYSWGGLLSENLIHKPISKFNTTSEIADTYVHTYLHRRWSLPT